MKTKVLLCLGIVLGIFYAGGETAAQSEVALATRAAKLQALSEKLKKPVGPERPHRVKRTRSKAKAASTAETNIRELSGPGRKENHRHLI